ncbi:SLAM family member 7-like isoform X1 [Embiotoca jacksoni]|uniref:SLAM family member 7-like isoform X1 n=1 Tax=Embiotoca jacksoni TaxID=100190 RepID=UPI003703F720
MSRWKMLLLLSCWIITAVMAKDPSATHYRLKSSSVCLRVRKPPPVHSGTWKFGETLFASDKFIKPSHRERVFFSPGNLSLCLNKLTDGDSGIYEVSFYDSNFTSTSETHQVIVQEQVPQPVMEMLVLRSNVSTGFCNITVNCSVRDDWVWFVCDENNCTASGKSFSKVNITVVTDNRTVVCSGNNHVSKSNVSKSKDLCFSKSKPEKEDPSEQLYEILIVIVFVVVLFSCIGFVAMRRFSKTSNLQQARPFPAQEIRNPPTETQPRLESRVSTSSSQAEASYENVDVAQFSRSSGPRQEQDWREIQTVDTVYSTLQMPHAAASLGRSDSSSDGKGHEETPEAWTSDSVPLDEEQSPACVDTVYSVLQKQKNP